MRQWFRSGTPWIWLTAGAVSLSLIMVVGLLILIAVRGLAHFWPSAVFEAHITDAQAADQLIIGEIHDRERILAQHLREAGITLQPTTGTWVERLLIKTGNRDASGQDFRWTLAQDLRDIKYPTDLAVVERREWGNLYGRIVALKDNGQVVAEGAAAVNALKERLPRTRELVSQIRKIEKFDIGHINARIERMRLKQRKLELAQQFGAPQRAELDAERAEAQMEFQELQTQLRKMAQDSLRDSAVVEISDGRRIDVPLGKWVNFYFPNDMNVVQKIGFYLAKAWEFVSDEPREANTEGGIFPAIFGTIMMVLVMSVLVTPFGVVAAVYLREYAKQGVVTRLIRIAVNNLAGVPSIVYGVFGLGFFVYFLGGNIDQLFFPEALPTPTFGTPGILWSSITLALLTVPVVIVATEEGLSRTPRAIREGSLALGATQFETLWRTVIPMASPAIMTGLILAVARAAGEVAPLMLVGVVKLAPSLPLDGEFPYLHLDRKFMHLGFHIHDVGFQSPNIEAARPVVYATALLLVLVVILLNIGAIGIRNHLREKYRSLEH
ncbi:MAG: phosphate ABC transporter permease PstA [Gammaproteobacteria bacterium]|nr:phosphate ABC transporter permease PstA [Gammaproteobacteria bacterium]